jgi:hypothetical protein
MAFGQLDFACESLHLSFKVCCCLSKTIGAFLTGFSKFLPLGAIILDTEVVVLEVMALGVAVVKLVMVAAESLRFFLDETRCCSDASSVFPAAVQLLCYLFVVDNCLHATRWGLFEESPVKSIDFLYCSCYHMVVRCSIALALLTHL